MFGIRSRKTDERIADFAVDLKRLSATCKFGNFLDEALCMQFVVGLSMSEIQSRLMQESTLAFETAVKIAIAEHAAITSCAEIEPSTSRDSADRVHHVTATKHANPARVNKSSCWRCGNSNHTPENCRFKTQSCHGCNRVGHIQKRCDAVRKWTRDKKPRPVHYVTTETAEDNVINHLSEATRACSSTAGVVESSPEDAGCLNATTTSGDKIAPYHVAVNISGERVLFQLDTAASVSVVGEHIYKTQMSHFTLAPAGLSLTSYSGDPIDVLGKINVPVEYDGQSEILPLIVVGGDKPALLGRNWLSRLKLDWGKIFAVRNNAHLDSLLTEYDSVFSDNVGEIQGFEADVHIDDDVQPIFKKAYQVPFAIRDRIKAQLQTGIDKGVFTVVKSSEWASPQVNVVKPSGDFRLCGDYKVTVNQVLKSDPYPLQSANDLFATLNGAKYFSKIDLTDAFQQLKLSDRSKALLTVNTIMGLLTCNRLPYGIKTAPQIFQRMMDEMLKGIEGVTCYIDDILICSNTETEHYDVLKQVLCRLQEHNVRARMNKCCFLQSSIDYLGHHIDAEGVHPTKSKVEALLEAQLQPM